MKREQFPATGGLDPDQKIDEDAGLCCAFATSGACPWYEDTPGARVYLDHTHAGANSAQLTRATTAETMLDYYLRTWKNYQSRFRAWSEARWFLGARFLRRAAKLGADDSARQFIAGVRPLPLAAAFRIFIA